MTNQGGVEEWLKKCPEKKWRKIMELSDSVPHHCLTCWWLQFKEGKPNRGCRYDDFNSEKLPFKDAGGVCGWTCLGWRVDPEARTKRVQGIQGFVM